MPIPFPGFELRTMARPRTCPVGKSKIRSIVEPSLGVFAACKKSPPSPITSAREVVVCADDFHATHSPLGARMRGYFRNFSTSDATFSPYKTARSALREGAFILYRLPCPKSIRRRYRRRIFEENPRQ